jgi:transcriptional regulator with XRE-family HTH domain
MTPTDFAPWGKVLALLRISRGWNQKQLAAAAGIQPATVSDYERDQNALKVGRLHAFTTIMGFPSEAIDRALAFLKAMDASREIAPARGGAALTAQIERLATEVGYSWEEKARSTLNRMLQEGLALDARRRAPDLWARLYPLPAAERRVLVENGEEFHSWALCELVCEESARAAADRADRALELAQLALRIARHVAGDDACRAQVQGHAWGFVGNARRVANDFAGADKAFTRSKQLSQAGAAADPPLLDSSRLLDLEASLRSDQRRVPEALALLDRALAASRSPERRARLLIKQAKIFEGQRDYEAAVALLRQAAPLVEEQSDPRLRLIVRLNLISDLSDLGRPEEALALVDEARALAADLDNELDLLRLRWIEGRLASALGREEEAITAFDAARRAFAARKMPYDAALATLDLAQLLGRQARTAQVKTLARETAAVFAALSVSAEARRALEIFREAAEAERLSAELASRLATYFCRARRAPHLPFDPAAAR